jgi:glycosyltransferase involved in cell wall biosynthesis
VAASAESRYETTVIMPARNEEAGLLPALESLAGQTEPPSLILVVVNNSSDRTEELARAFAARADVPPTVVLDLPHNPRKKAGALNHGPRWLTDRNGGRLTGITRHILVMDADTVLHHEFVRRAVRALAADRSLGGVSATCLGRTGLCGSPRGSAI